MNLNATPSGSLRTVAQLLTTTSLQHRAHLAKEFSKLRRVRPRVPFFKLVAHRLPTRWGLYRDLLRCLPQVRETKQESRWRWKDFRDEEWDSRAHGKALLDHLQSPTPSPQALKVARYERLIRARREKVEMQRVYDKELEWIEKMKKRPILTGGYLRPSLYNRPLPRMKNQPIHITMMIKKRIKARAKRIERQGTLIGWLEDVKTERLFESNLQKEIAGETGNLDSRQPEFEAREYETAIRDSLKSITQSFELDRQRAASKFTPEMITLIKNARKAKIANKTRERERELRGEVTNR
ncbi:hypothetical protein FRC17_007976, partial [Serendipita sp. 399]